MRYYEKLELLKKHPKTIKKRLGDFLLFQIYSPSVLRQAHSDRSELPWYIWEKITSEIRELINETHNINDKQLEYRLNEYHIRQAVSVLSAYQTCNTPITQDRTIHQYPYKWTSQRGDKALSILKNALAEKQFSNKMADLALHS